MIEHLHRIIRITLPDLAVSAMSPPNKAARVQVDPLDLEGKSGKEHIQMALKAITHNGFKENGQPWLSIREVALTFQVKRGVLGAQFNGRKTRKEAHEHEKTLTFAQERALVDWVKEMGCRGIPLHASAVAHHASAILGTPISERWVHRFCSRHPDLKAKWTTGLEKCRAQSQPRGRQRFL